MSRNGHTGAWGSPRPGTLCRGGERAILVLRTKRGHMLTPTGPGAGGTCVAAAQTPRPEAAPRGGLTPSRSWRAVPAQAAGLGPSLAHVSPDLIN